MNLGPTKISGTYLYVLNQSGANAITLGNGNSVNWNAGGVVSLADTQNIVGAKTFSQLIIGSINGNAATATLATNATNAATATNATSVTNGVYTTGNQNIAGTKTFSNIIGGSITGNAATATLATNATSVTNGVYTTGNQTISGNLNIFGNIITSGNLISSGISNTLPNQTAVTPDSILTKQLADARYFILNESSSIIGTSIFI